MNSHLTPLFSGRRQTVSLSSNLSCLCSHQFVIWKHELWRYLFCKLFAFMRMDYKKCSLVKMVYSEPLNLLPFFISYNCSLFRHSWPFILFIFSSFCDNGQWSPCISRDDWWTIWRGYPQFNYIIPQPGHAKRIIR